MPFIVNVEDLEFEELIPLLRENIHIQENNHYEKGTINYQRDEEKIFNWLRNLLQKLKNGKPAEHFTIGDGFRQCLEKKGRVLMYSEHHLMDEWDDHVMNPITKQQMKDFLERLENGSTS